MNSQGPVEALVNGSCEEKETWSREGRSTEEGLLSGDAGEGKKVGSGEGRVEGMLAHSIYLRSGASRRGSTVPGQGDPGVAITDPVPGAVWNTCRL